MNSNYNSHVRSFLFSLTLFVAVGLEGDTWTSAKTKEYYSLTRNFCFVVKPDAKWPESFGRCLGSLYRCDNGRRHKVWSRYLINNYAPVNCYVADSGKSVVTTDEWGRVGQFPVVLYGVNGRLVNVYNLDSFHFEDDMVQITRSVSNTWWDEGAICLFGRNDEVFIIRLQWGRELFIDAATGTLLGPPSPLLSMGHFLDLVGLIRDVTMHTNAVSDFVWERFSAEHRRLWNSTVTNLQGRQDILVVELNAIIRGDAIYDAHRFAGVSLSPQAEELLARNPRGFELARLNRLLLCDAYPGKMARIPPLPKTYRDQYDRLSKDADQALTAMALRLMASQDPEERRIGAVYSGQMKLKECVPSLKALLGDKETEIITSGGTTKKAYYVRKAAKEALQRMGIAVDNVTLEESMK